ncbi:branched-chain-amino-acid aminotransferase [Entophlyctis luteolus]|nr:branched-chain-amino-acid aminotransferase [Entophlyctis luteolus]KAJ3347663.1 branched-chain-amino-acid aminotransferase [Entophlyctis luteolus]KAJ3383789.1 branched-chain-amino-acid aminotransferase [Entophlyctis sp. JEL0112]
MLFLRVPALARRGLATSALRDISAASIAVRPTDSPKLIPPNKDLVFGHTFADHMLNIDWNSKTGWDSPLIHKYQNLSISPSATVFHYALECFEGMKAYKDKSGNIRLFRPDMNMNRLLRSCRRLALPEFDKNELLDCIKKLLLIDERWIPSERGYSLYVRPTAIATQESLGVGPSSQAKIFVITCPVGPYYKTGFAAVSLSATSHYTRAWPGGTGDCKVGGNYAPGIRPQIEVGQKGYAQNLWLFGPEDNLTEVGTMNLFVFWKNKQTGKPELITPPLDGTILPGVTRDSILQLARSWGEFDVSEKPVTMPEIVDALQEGRLIEMFGAGTAAIVSPIKNISYKNVDWAIPLDPSDASSQAGKLTKRFADTIMGIQYGEIPHEWSVVVKQ